MRFSQNVLEVKYYVYENSRETMNKMYIVKIVYSTFIIKWLRDQNMVLPAIWSNVTLTLACVYEYKTLLSLVSIKIYINVCSLILTFLLPTNWSISRVVYLRVYLFAPDCLNFCEKTTLQTGYYFFTEGLETKAS